MPEATHIVAPAVSVKVTVPPFAMVTLAGLNALPLYETVAAIDATAGAVALLSVPSVVGICAIFSVGAALGVFRSTAGAEAEFHHKSATAATMTIITATNHPVFVINK